MGSRSVPKFASLTGVESGEGHDRKDLNVQGKDDELIEAVAKANKNTIVVLNNAGVVLTPWADKVSAIVVQFMAGQEGGNALADVLFGAVNPSGKLPLTFPNKDNEQQFY